MTTVNRREYGKALSTYGFNYHNVIRYRRDSGIDKVSKRQVDWYMNNLLKRPDVSMVWACVEPDYDKYTGQTYNSNHVHFAYVGKKSNSFFIVLFLVVKIKFKNHGFINRVTNPTRHFLVIINKGHFKCIPFWNIHHFCAIIIFARKK